MPQNLNLIRQENKKKLRNLPQNNCVTATQKITPKIIKHVLFSNSQNIACYVPIENEINVWAIIKTIWQLQKNCYLPAIHPKIKNQLQFVKFNERDKLTIEKYKIPQPKICQNKIIASQDLDLVIVPLIGFNTDGFRIGRGAGYYDRAFAFKQQQQNPNTKPYLLGVGYKWQQVKFTPNSWDIAMNEVITP